MMRLMTEIKASMMMDQMEAYLQKISSLQNFLLNVM